MSILDKTVKAFLAFGLIASSLALGACNTVEGFGRDMENAGDAISKEAQEAK
ncbi:entericidin EcnAB [Tepidicaulis marinus]|jgi:predicted small secreted protein|uniref:Entericidin EcnAB n=1 Tax=Tepidicaulis marinus TaxID=1333998 RepID=A0A081BBT8_9HYPH|nr:entericidin A/B family lipoprotein [Tepidicaulis marinus]GAK45506.1 entericidin EcnAB [Tepidicaulis marinus]